MIYGKHDIVKKSSYAKKFLYRGSLLRKVAAFESAGLRKKPPSHAIKNTRSCVPFFKKDQKLSQPNVGKNLLTPEEKVAVAKRNFEQVYQRCIEAEFLDDETKNLVASAVYDFREFTEACGDDEDNAAHINAVAESGVIHGLCELLIAPAVTDDIKTMVTRALSNVAYSNRADVVFQSNAIHYMKHMLAYPDLAIRIRVLCTFANLAADNVQYRDFLLADDVLIDGLIKNLKTVHEDGYIQSLSDVESLVVVQNTLWVMANLTSALPNPSSERMRPLLVPIVDWLRRASDIRGPAKLDVITYGIKAIKNMLYGGNTMIVDDVVQIKAIEPLLYILRRKIRDKEMSLLILSCIGNLTSGEAILASGFLEHAIWILKNSSSDNVRAQTCWILNILSAQDVETVTAIFNRKLVSLVLQLATNSRFALQKEALQFICNLHLHGDGNHIAILMQMGGSKALAVALSQQTEVGLVQSALTSVEKIIRCPKIKYALPILTAAGVLEQIDRLIDLDHHQAYHQASSLHELLTAVNDENDLRGQEETKPTPKAFFSLLGKRQRGESNSEMKMFAELPTNPTLAPNSKAARARLA